MTTRAQEFQIDKLVLAIRDAMPDGMSTDDLKIALAAALAGRGDAVAALEQAATTVHQLQAGYRSPKPATMHLHEVE